MPPKEDKIQIKQFKDSSSNWFVNYAHYHLNKNGEIEWCAGETDKEELREELSRYIRRNKKSYKCREQSLFLKEVKEYSVVKYGKFSGLTTLAIVAENKSYAKWLYENTSDSVIKNELKELLKIK